MSGARFWMVVALLAAATIGCYSLQHGERDVSRQPLSFFPMQVGLWKGTDIDLSERIARATGADDILNRGYFGPEGDLSLYIGYYRSQRTGDTIHSPKNCLPGGGWQPVSSEYSQITAPDGRVFSVNLYIVEKGLDRTLVLYWYQSHGRIIASEYSAKFYMIADAIRMNRTDAALVRIATPVAGNEAVARQRAASFARALLPQLETFIPR